MNECILITAIGSMAAKTVIQKLKDNYHVIGCDIYEKNGWQMLLKSSIFIKFQGLMIVNISLKSLISVNFTMLNT